MSEKLEEFDEVATIGFDKFELGEIFAYQEILGVDTPRKAIMNAIRIVMDDMIRSGS